MKRNELVVGATGGAVPSVGGGGGGGGGEVDLSRVVGTGRCA